MTKFILESIIVRACGVVALISCLAVPERLSGNPVVPGAEVDHPVALIGGTIYPVVSDPIEKGTVLLENGKISAVGDALEIPSNAKTIEIEGLRVYPGLINTDGLVGLVEINSVRATRDYAETGDINPNVRAEVAVNPDSELLPVTRSAGVLFNLTTPRGGLVSGTSALLQLDGWTWEDLTVKAPVGMHINWPRVHPVSQSGDDKQSIAEPVSLIRLRKLFYEARAYREGRNSGDIEHSDPRFESLVPVLTGNIPIIVAADSEAQIRSVIAFSVEQSVKLIIYGGYDAERCATLLRRFDIPVIIGGIHRLPRRRFEPYDWPFTLPNRLRQAGVRFCIAARDSFNAPNTRNLPYQAAHAVAFGLPPEEALKAVTTYPARILQLGHRIGAIAPGMDASVIVTDGDPLETTTHVVRAFIQGREVDLDDRQKALWRKYRERIQRHSAAATE